MCPLVYTKSLANNKPSRSTHEFSAKKCKHHEVLKTTMKPSKTITKYSRFTQLAIPHEVLTCFCCCCLLLSEHPSRSTHECCLSIHYEVLKFALQSAVHPSRSTHVLLLLMFVVVEKTSITKYTRMLSVHPSRSNSTLPCSQLSIHHEVLTCCCCRCCCYCCRIIRHEVLTQIVLAKTANHIRQESRKRGEPKTQTANTEQTKPTDQSLCT